MKAKEEIDVKNGLSTEEVTKRKLENLVNYDTTVPTKSIKRILFENFFTLFNFLNLFLGIVIFLVGSYKNMLFLGVVIINTAISTFQEIHAKRVVDKLSVLASSKAKVIRDGKKQEISIYELVIDDIIELGIGNQIVTDSSLLEGEVQVNESFLTGEPNNITKKQGDRLLSGSYVVSGKCLAKVEHVGEDNYTAKISSGAKYVKKVNSEIMKSLKKIIEILTFAIIPIGLGLFYSQLQLQGATFQEAVVKSVAAMIGMIPEGLVLLTSTVLAVSVIRLSRSKVLVQELYCIETLARVDTLCLDKTGTLTEGKMEVKDFIPIKGNKDEMKNILAHFAKEQQEDSTTMEAIKNYFKKPKEKWEVSKKIPFSSETKWSGVTFQKQGTYVIGAPEIILKKEWKKYQEMVEKYTKDYRVLVLAHSKQEAKDKSLPEEIEVIGLVCLLDKIRKEAKSTLKYFEKQGVALKIISGDNPITVSQIAKQVGLKNYESYIDMSCLKEESMEEIAIKYSIFGRVSPTQKEELVKALQKQGKTVAMTGDGVNDVLALKKADCSIAMENSSDATRSVAQLILLDSNFASMPKIVAEGRRTINNIERSASLFLVKTIYSCILAIMFLIMQKKYPFIPIQMSLISLVTIGIPSFLLALEPNKERIQGKFLSNVIIKALPTALTVALNIFVISILNQYGILTQEQYSSLCVISTGICGLLLLFTLTKTRKSEETKLPVSIYRLSLAILLTGIFILGLTRFNWWFNITSLMPIGKIILRIFVISIINFSLLTILVKKGGKENKRKKVVKIT